VANIYSLVQAITIRNKTLAEKPILIVDDELESAKILRIALEWYGFPVACFVTAGDALENFGLDIYCYSLILTDLRMPGMDGLEFARRIKEMRRDIKICLLTAHPFMESILNSKNNLPFDKILIKPVSMIDLINGIREVLRS
jgi:CheY-like chemotaxis protein